MHKKIVKFLSSGWYIGLCFLISFLSWSLSRSLDHGGVTDFHIYTLIGSAILISIMATSLVLFDNTMYTVPPIFGLLFIVSKKDMTFETLKGPIPYIVLGILFLSFIIHMIRFKPKFTWNKMSLALLLIAIGYVIPLTYTLGRETNKIGAITVSMMGFLYFIVYLFFANTLKGNKDFLMKLLVLTNLLLTAQLFFVVYTGLKVNADLPFVDAFYAGIKGGWFQNLGWANINDVCFYIALTFPAYFYFIIKKPKTMFLWFVSLLPFIGVFISGSRGGLIGFFFSCLGSLILLIKNGNKDIRDRGMITFLAFFIIVMFFYPAAEKVWLALSESFNSDINAFSSGRIMIYKEGLRIFKQYPIFGGSWMSIHWFDFPGRLFMFHSTPIQALATMGLFGMGVLIYFYYVFGKMIMNKKDLVKTVFLTGFIASQIHGLIDNVQYAVIYSFMISIIIPFFTVEK